MRILFVNDYGTPTGGAETMIIALRDGMRARGHEAILFSSSAHPHGATSASDHECFGTLGPARAVIQTFNLSAYMQLKKLLRDFRPDIVHVKVFLTQLSPSILPLFKDVPSIYHAVWYRAVCPTGTKTLPDMTPCRQSAGLVCAESGCVRPWDWPLLMGQMKLWRRWADAFDEIVPISAAVKQVLAAEGIESGEVVPNGSIVRPPRQRLDEQPTVAFAGRLVPEKGADLLLDAMGDVIRRIPSARLLIAGDGPQRIELEQRAAKLGIDRSVEFLGHLSRNRMEDRLEGAWAQVVCSRWAEPFGMVAIEAMMRGVAVIVTESGGLTEIIEHERTGLIVPINDVRALAGGILGLLTDRDRARNMGITAYQVALEKYSLDRMLDRFESIYSRTIAQSRKTRRQTSQGGCGAKEMGNVHRG